MKEQQKRDNRKITIVIQNIQGIYDIQGHKIVHKKTMNINTRAFKQMMKK